MAILIFGLKKVVPGRTTKDQERKKLTCMGSVKKKKLKNGVSCKRQDVNKVS